MTAVVMQIEHGEAGPASIWARLATWPVRFAEWTFGPRAPHLDLGLMSFSGGWAVLEVTRPHIFDAGSLTGLSWVADPYWLALHVILTALHAIGLVRLHWTALRAGAALLSAWHWLFVAVSLLRVEMSTGVLAYALLGTYALVGGIYVVGVPPRARG